MRRAVARAGARVYVGRVAADSEASALPSLPIAMLPAGALSTPPPLAVKAAPSADGRFREAACSTIHRYAGRSTVTDLFRLREALGESSDEATISRAYRLLELSFGRGYPS